MQPAQVLAEQQLAEQFKFRIQTWVWLQPQNVAGKAMRHDRVQWDLKSAGAAISVSAVLLFDLKTCCSASECYRAAGFLMM